ncbi:LysR family transcriptional regulator [Nonomuraea endophytica]|uniref:LysR family transcriptional regulator n=1 Tax=Nonomuraea endophytica TaxID=714136 RepID=UPI0037CC0DAF
MERHEIETVLTLAEELHFGRTAERLLISTGRVSHLVKKIEREVGAPLFERTSRQVRLTPLGRQFLDGLAPAYRELQEQVSRAKAAARGIGGTLRAGFLGVTSQHLLEVMDVFCARHPECEVQLRELQYGEPFGPLRRDEIDVLLTWFPIEEPDLATGPVLVTEAMHLAVSPTRHRLSGRDGVHLADLDRREIFSLPYAGEPAWTGAHLLDGAEGQPIHSLQEALSLSSAGLGVFPVGAAVADLFTCVGIEYVPIRDAPALSFGLVWRAAAETNRVRAFNEAACEVFLHDVPLAG